LHKVFVMAFLLIISAGCSSQQMTKEQYFNKGLEFLQSGHPSGAIIAFKKAIEQDQNYFEARFKLANAYILNNKFESAERELHKVLRLNPSFHEAHLLLSKAYLNLRMTDKAIKEAEAYMKYSSEDAETYEIIAQAYAIKRDYLKSEELLNKALEISPQRISSKLLLAEILIVEGNLESAGRIIKEIIGQDRDNIDALYLLARVQQNSNDLNGAMNTYEIILSKDSKDRVACFRMGNIYLNNKNLDKAKEMANRLLTSHAKRYEGPYLMGLVHFFNKQYDEAIISLKMAAKRKPIAGASYYMGLCYLAKERLELASSEFQRVTEMSPGLIQGQLLLAITHLRNGRAEEAEKVVARALELDESNAFAHNLLGSVYLALGKNDLALKEFDRTVELHPELSDAYLKKGFVKLISGNQKDAENDFVSAVEISPELLNSRILLTKYYIHNKKFQDAIRTLKEGFEGTPRDALLSNMIGIAYLGAKDKNRAIEFFHKAKEFNPEFFQPYFNLARVYLNSKEKDKAISEYMEVLDIDTNNDDALIMLAKIMEADNKPQEALSYYMKAKEQKRPEAYIALAQYYLRKKENEKAINILDEALVHDLKNLDVLDMKGSIYMVDNNYNAALSVYRKMEELDPDSGAMKLAGLYEVQGDLDAAIEKLESLLIRRADRTEILVKLVSLNMKKEHYSEAERRAKEIIKLKPENATGHSMLASVYLATQKLDEAERELKTAISMDPNGFNARIPLGRLYVARKNYEKAIKVYKDIENEKPEYAPIHFLQGSIYDELNKEDLAIAKYKRTIELSPEYVPALNNLAYLYASGYGSIDEAVDLAEKAQQLMPKSGSVADTIGWVLYKKGDYDEALKNFIKATHYIPDEPTIRYHLALAYLEKGMNASAEEQFKNAIRLGRLKPFAEFEETQTILRSLD